MKGRQAVCNKCKQAMSNDKSKDLLESFSYLMINLCKKCKKEFMQKLSKLSA
jgi:NAD-dependent SIR2 family protein deacetylase